MGKVMYWKLSELAKIKVRLLDAVLVPIYRCRMGVIDKEYDRCESGYYKITGVLPERGVLLDDVDFYHSL